MDNAYLHAMLMFYAAIYGPTTFDSRFGHWESLSARSIPAIAHPEPVRKAIGCKCKPAKPRVFVDTRRVSRGQHARSEGPSCWNEGVDGGLEKTQCGRQEPTNFRGHPRTGQRTKGNVAGY